jgi:hypothetical protein
MSSRHLSGTTTTMEIGDEQTILYITHWQIEDYRRAGWIVKPLDRVRGDNVHCYIAIEPTCPDQTE